MKCKLYNYSFLHIGLIVFFLMINLLVFGQVENNSIHSRIELILNENVGSTTANSTVEWDCVNKKLTDKCLVYHNDQWFSFIPSVSGKYFINISSQQCQKNLGVQLIIIEGDPCLITSYKILNCISKIIQDDVFVELDSLQAERLYLINVDGFLGDFCRFKIQVGDKPAGMPWRQQSLDTLRIQAASNNNIVDLNWNATQQQLDQLDYFEVNRLLVGERKSTTLRDVYVRSNSLGKHELFYNTVDTLLSHGIYQYSIIGVYRETGYRELLDEVVVSFKRHDDFSKQFIAKVPLSFTGKGKLNGKVINASTDEVLTTIQYDYVYPETLGVNLTKFVNRGTIRFWIKIKNDKTKEFQQFTFQVNAEGEVKLLQK